MGLYDKIINKFDGHERGPDDDQFEKYAKTWSRVCFDRTDKEYWDWCILRLSSLFANSNIMPFTNGDHKGYRHLKRDEYDRLSNLRLSAGTGQLLPYDEVKAKDDRLWVPDEVSLAFDKEQTEEILEGVEF